MAQNERNGRGGKGSGANRPADPDTNPRSIQAPPPPETPIGQRSEGGDAADETPGDGGDEDKQRPEAEVLAELKRAQEAVDGLEVELAAIREQGHGEEENDRIIADYTAQVGALKDRAAELELFRTAEITFLEKMLPDDARKELAKVEGELQAELNGLIGNAANAQAALDNQQRLLDEAKRAEEAATAKLEGLSKPLDPIRAKLRDGEALRTAVNKAEEAEDYALAFWLVMEGGRLQRRLSENPIREPDALRAEIALARQAQAAARADIAPQEAPIANLTKALEAAKAVRDTAKSTLEERLLKRISELNPNSAEPA
jgi:hypothetical protein